MAYQQTHPDDLLAKFRRQPFQCFVTWIALPIFMFGSCVADAMRERYNGWTSPVLLGLNVIQLQIFIGMVLFCASSIAMNVQEANLKSPAFFFAALIQCNEEKYRIIRSKPPLGRRFID